MLPFRPKYRVLVIYTFNLCDWSLSRSEWCLSEKAHSEATISVTSTWRLLHFNVTRVKIRRQLTWVQLWQQLQILRAL